MNRMKSIFIFSISLLALHSHANTLDRIEYKLERINLATNNLAEEVNEINNIINGDPFVPFTNWNGNLYPVELYSTNTQVQLAHITGLSRFPRSQAALRIPHIEEYGGIWWRNVVAESWIGVNPTNQSNFIVATTQDRSNLRETLGVIALFSIDGGDTWDQAHIPLTRCSDSTPGHSLGDFQTASKPTVAFDRDGSNQYLICVSNNYGTEALGEFSPHKDEAIVLVRSQDGGASWNEPNIVFGDDGQDHLLFVASVWANPFVDDLVYAVWSDFQYIVGNGNNSVIRVARSFDAGNTWEPPMDVVTVDSSAENFFPFRPEILVSPFGADVL